MHTFFWGPRSNLMTIPTCLHLIWNEEPLSYLNFCTVASFIHFHPTWTVMLWKIPGNGERRWTTPEHKEFYIGKDYYPQLFDFSQVVEQDVNMLTNLNLPRGIEGVHLSDYLRLYILYKFGGVYSDFDVIYISSINRHLNEEANFGIPFCYTHRDNPYFPVGFMYATPQSKVLEYLLSLIHLMYSPAEYQCIGRYLFCNDRMLPFYSSNLQQFSNNLSAEFQERVHVMEGNGYMKYNHADAQNLFFTNTVDNRPCWGEDCFGIHWFNGLGVAKRYQNSFNNGVPALTNLDPFIRPYFKYL